MATKQYTVTVEDDDRVAIQVLELLKEAFRRVDSGDAPAPAANPESGRMLEPCQICDKLFDAESLGTTKQLALSDIDKACPICVGAANRVWARFREAAVKEANEISRQLPQIVKDIRAGAPYPDYYRGLE